jgi:NADP-dependent 3-hydroxy acid dehydrogenase YdfG
MHKSTEKTGTIFLTGAGSEAALSMGKLLASQFNYRMVMISRGSVGPRPDWLSNDDYWIADHDLTSDDDVGKLHDYLSGIKFDGRLTTICATGKFVGFTPIRDHSIDQFRQLLESNLLAVHGAAKCLLPLMVAHGGGHFITLGSLAAEMAYPYLVPFSTAKIALQFFVRGISNEYLRHGIVATNLALATLDTDEERSLRPFGKHGDWLTPKDLAEAVHGIIQSPSVLHGGNSIHVFKYSDTYYKDSWLERIGKKDDLN